MFLYGAETAGERRFFFLHIYYTTASIRLVSAKLLARRDGTGKNIPIICCLGAGNKLDPTRFE
jgi:tRNA A37 threonylcarbamoyladenosine dehydratase